MPIAVAFPFRRLAPVTILPVIMEVIFPEESRSPPGRFWRNWPMPFLSHRKSDPLGYPEKNSGNGWRENILSLPWFDPTMGIGWPLPPFRTGQRSSLFILTGGLSGGTQQDSRLDLLIVDWTFGTEELSTYSKYIQQVEKVPCLFMHPNDASKMGLNDKDKCTLSLDRGPLELEVRIVENMAPGVIILPHHRQLDWQKLKGLPVKWRLTR